MSEVVILALTQGLTEFLPISSSGHLVLVRIFFNIPDVEGTAFDAVLHLGTAGAVLLYYRHIWWGILRGIFVPDQAGRASRQLLMKLIVATFPAALAGYLFADKVDELLRGPLMLSAGLVVTAFLLLWSDIISRRPKFKSEPTKLDAFYIGLAQIVALIPSVSRSGVTIAAGCQRGLSRQEAANFSFIMSAPIIAGAGLSGLENLAVGNNFSAAELIVGIIISFVAGLLSVHLFIKLMGTMSLKPFVIYLAAVATLILVLI